MVWHLASIPRISVVLWQVSFVVTLIPPKHFFPLKQTIVHIFYKYGANICRMWNITFPCPCHFLPYSDIVDADSTFIKPFSSVFSLSKNAQIFSKAAFKQTHIITAESPVLECVIVYCLCRVSSVRATHCAWRDWCFVIHLLLSCKSKRSKGKPTQLQNPNKEILVGCLHICGRISGLVLTGCWSGWEISPRTMGEC